MDAEISLTLKEAQREQKIGSPEDRKRPEASLPDCDIGSEEFKQAPGPGAGQEAYATRIFYSGQKPNFTS